MDKNRFSVTLKNHVRIVLYPVSLCILDLGAYKTGFNLKFVHLYIRGKLFLIRCDEWLFFGYVASLQVLGCLYSRIILNSPWSRLQFDRFGHTLQWSIHSHREDFKSLVGRLSPSTKAKINRSWKKYPTIFHNMGNSIVNIWLIVHVL